MSFEINVKQFQGPLDLLLQLVSKAKIDLRDIFLSEITEQFISIVQEAAQVDPDGISEFISLAAELIEIKSRRLLPKPPREEEEDPEELLLRRLEAYQQVQLQAARMAETEKSAREIYGKLPEEILLEPVSPQLEEMDISMLWEALVRIGNRRKEAPREVVYVPRAIHRDNHTVQECVEAIQSRLLFGRVSFEELLSAQPDREEIVTVFCALLELLKLGLAHTEQQGTLGRMILVPGAREDHSEYTDEHTAEDKSS